MVRRSYAFAPVGLVAVALIVLAAGCRTASRTSAAANETASSDTVRGVVRAVGSDPRRTLVLMSPGSSLVALSADDAKQERELQAAEGLEIMAHGKALSERNPEAAPGGAAVFRVRRFVVRAADGVAARDGILREQQGRWVLEVASGETLPIVGLPAALASHAGARVFLVGPANQAPQAFGILRPAAR